MTKIRYIVGKDGKKLEIREPRAADLDSLIYYINEFSDERTFILWQGEHVTHQQEKEYIESLLKCLTSSTCVHLLVLDGNKVVGAGGVKSADRVRSHVVELNIALLKKYRANGFGEQLLLKVIDDAKKNIKGLKILTLEVFGCNVVGKNLYRKIGFKKYGVLPNGIKWRGKFVDVEYMYLEL